MKTLRFAAVIAALLVGFAAPALAQVGCDQSASYDASTNGATRLVTGDSVNRVYVCGFTIVAGGTATVGLVTGTGTNCATGQAALTPSWSMVAQTVVPDSSPAWRGLLAAPGLDVCIKTNAGVAVQAIVYFSKR
ncbi:MAG: hypothetical protein WC670_18380 [Pseudolabrys sp.]|jgi:hypothetical protein